MPRRRRHGLLPVPLSDAKLLEYSKEHVVYEWSSLINAAASLGNLSEEFPRCAWVGHALHQGQERMLTNFLLESFAVHLRNLIDFVDHSETPYETDVVAADFYEEPRRWQVTLPPALALARTQAHKQIAHLTTDRPFGDDGRKKWHIRECVGSIHELLVRFATGAAPARLHPSFLTELRLNAL
jgi:hypothetical protein